MKNRARAKKAAAGQQKGTIKFDPLARQRYITGFQKRKQERRRKGMEELLQKERWDQIEVRKEHREQVKKNWRDLQRAEALTLRALGDVERPLQLEDGATYEAIQDGAVTRTEAPVTVAFAQEEDDPFGDCEVTTIMGDTGLTASKLWPALLGSGNKGGARRCWTPEDYDADTAAADTFARQRRRAVVKKREEARERDALARRVAKKLGLSSKRRPKTKNSKSKDKNTSGKSTHRSRRKIAKKAAKR